MFEPRSWRDVFDTTLCDKVCLRFAEGWWFSPGTPSEKGQVKIHTALVTGKIKAHEPHSKQGMNAAVDAKGTKTMLCGF